MIDVVFTILYPANPDSTKDNSMTITSSIFDSHTMVTVE